MPAQDTSEVKEKIVSIFKRRGPSLPVHVSQETGLSILFASVFLSELLSEKKLGISNMKVGNTPIYFIPGQEPMLERFSEHLKSKEKESFNLLKEKTFLKDSEQEPAIRVALRSLKDFAVPFKKNDEFYWKYFIVSKEELKNFLEERKTEIKSESSKKIIEEKPKKIKKKTGKKPKRTLNLKQSEKFLDKTYFVVDHSYQFNTDVSPFLTEVNSYPSKETVSPKN